MWDSSRKFLKRNKIFFDTFIIPVLAIILSIQANNLLNSQNELIKLQLMPKFDVLLEHEFDESQNLFTGRYLRILNLGKGQNNISSKALVVLKLNVVDNKGNTNEIRLPLDGYFYTYFETGASEGLICEIKGFKNHDKFIKLDKNFLELSKKKGLFSASMDLEKYVRISYTDSFEKNHEEFYSIPHNTAIKLKSDYGEELFQKYKENEGTAVELSEVTAKKLFKILEQNH